MQISQVSITGADPRDFTGLSNGCGIAARGDSCIIQAQLEPIATGGRMAYITMYDNAPDAAPNA